VEQFLRQHVDEAAILFGLSAGGAITLAVAAECPELVRAIILGDAPIDLEATLPWIPSEEFKSWFSALRRLSGLNLSITELSTRIADIPVYVLG
jgi:pimeloyl-ACP methyl ester carboxylesterase